MLHLVHSYYISIESQPIKLKQAVNESLPHKSLYSLDPVPSSLRARNAQEINITNCDVTTWSWAWVGELSEPPGSTGFRSSKERLCIE